MPDWPDPNKFWLYPDQTRAGHPTRFNARTAACKDVSPPRCPPIIDMYITRRSSHQNNGVPAIAMRPAGTALVAGPRKHTSQTTPHSAATAASPAKAAQSARCVPPMRMTAQHSTAYSRGQIVPSWSEAKLCEVREATHLVSSQGRRPTTQPRNARAKRAPQPQSGQRRRAVATSGAHGKRQAAARSWPVYRERLKPTKATTQPIHMFSANLSGVSSEKAAATLGSTPRRRPWDRSNPWDRRCPRDRRNRYGRRRP